jgi:sigma-B regulation protein RsbU (phosphoserine phosphatase)
MVYANAAQYPHPILTRGDRSEVLPEKGMPIGLFDFAEFPNHEMDLPLEFRLTLFSDGALDLLQEGSLEDKLSQLEEMARDGKIETLFDLAQEQEELPDDVTALIIERGSPNV